jgi:hypothetical protein
MIILPLANATRGMSFLRRLIRLVIQHCAETVGPISTGRCRADGPRCQRGVYEIANRPKPLPTLNASFPAPGRKGPKLGQHGSLIHPENATRGLCSLHLARKRLHETASDCYIGIQTDLRSFSRNIRCSPRIEAKEPISKAMFPPCSDKFIA